MKAIPWKALASAAAIMGAGGANAQCVDEWHGIDWTVEVEGQTRYLNWVYAEAGGSLWSFVYAGEYYIEYAIGSEGYYGEIRDEFVAGADLMYAFQPVRWNGKTWVAVPNAKLFWDFSKSFLQPVELDGGMFIAGQFDGIEVDLGGGQTEFRLTKSVARFDLAAQRWDGAWSVAHVGVWNDGVGGGTVSDMQVHDGKLYLAGDFTHHRAVKTANPPGVLVRNIAMGVTCWDPGVWNDGDPIDNDDSPPGTGWVQINHGRNFLPVYGTQVEFYPVDGVDTLHAVGPEKAFTTAVATAPVDVTGNSFTDAVIRLNETGEYWEVVPGVFDSSDPFTFGCRIDFSEPVLQRFMLDGDDVLVARPRAFSYAPVLNGVCLDGLLAVWDGATWSTPILARAPSGTLTDNTEPWVSQLVHRNRVAADELYVNGVLRSAQAGVSAPAYISGMFGVDNAGERISMNSPTGSRDGYAVRWNLSPVSTALGGAGATQAFGRVFVACADFQSILTNATPLESDYKVAYWGSPLRCTGDANGDFTVTFADLNAVLGAYGTAAPNDPKDLNDDGVIDFADLNIVLAQFGSTCCQ